MTRSRPYRKNDNCYVEQKNFTHVRTLFGYVRLDDKALVPLMNEIYTKYWEPLQNFFIPTQKLIRKTRIGARIKKEYDQARTPDQRLLDSPALSEAKKDMLRQRKSQLNPFHLKRGLQKKLEEFEEQLLIRDCGLVAA